MSLMTIRAFWESIFDERLGRQSYITDGIKEVVLADDNVPGLCYARCG
jgi:hypothetical protein